MTKPFRAVTSAEAERLEMLIEECSEIIQASTKILRHGFNSTHPDNTPALGDRPINGKNNRNDIERELGDVLGIINFITEMGDVDENSVTKSMCGKIERAAKYMHHQDPVKIAEHIKMMKQLGAR